MELIRQLILEDAEHRDRSVCRAWCDDEIRRFEMVPEEDLEVGIVDGGVELSHRPRLRARESWPVSVEDFPDVDQIESAESFSEEFPTLAPAGLRFYDTACDIHRTRPMLIAHERERLRGRRSNGPWPAREVAINMKSKFAAFLGTSYQVEEWRRDFVDFRLSDGSFRRLPRDATTQLLGNADKLGWFGGRKLDPNEVPYRHSPQELSRKCESRLEVRGIGDDAIGMFLAHCTSPITDPVFNVSPPFPDQTRPHPSNG